ncbi:MAG: hypothetical protein IPH04_18955 [Saprospirales bacterium]|nr:hypothetical protein [Saprospirales bacterium]
MDVIITGGNADHFPYLELFVSSLRQNGGFTGTIALCDNAIEGTWDRPGKFREGGSFSPEQLQFFEKNQVEVFLYSELLAQNQIPREQIDSIPSPTQRYPHKFIYTTLISKNYLTKAKNICFFDADIYFQKPVQPIFERFTEDAVYIVAERLAIGQNHFLSKWIAHSDFSKLSDQGLYLSTMNQALNYCSGFFGGRSQEVPFSGPFVQPVDYQFLDAIFQRPADLEYSKVLLSLSLYRAFQGARFSSGGIP